MIVANNNTSTLGYLSSTQALADYATLIIDLKKNLSAIDSPVVFFGGSYGGSLFNWGYMVLTVLAAWFRLKYPHVTIGALASSSPILLFENITSPYAFNNVITQDFRSESENCYKVIKGSWQQIEDTANQPGGLESLVDFLYGAFVSTAETDYPTPSNFLSPMPAYPVKQVVSSKIVANNNTSTLGYLSSTQALADYATLIIDLKKNLSAIDSPVVFFGGSYGGSLFNWGYMVLTVLAAWFRLKYPHVTIGALASSSPILLFENVTSPYAFNNVITQDFRSESENCYKVIKGSWQQIEDTANQPGGLESLVDFLYGAFVSTAETDYPTPSNFLSPMPAYPVKQMCKAIDDPTARNDTYRKLYEAVTVFYNYTGDAGPCFDLADHSDPHGLGGWGWQSMIASHGGTEGPQQSS
ncbi:unnamed protein product [Camellia sinensis]